MAKRVTAMVKLQIPAGKATPAPPVGPALGQHGVNIMDFCKSFNAKTSAKDQEGLIIPVVITVFHDRSFTFVTKTPPASVLLKRAAGIAKGSGEPNRNKVGKVTEKQVEEIAKLKLPDLNARDLAAAVATIKVQRAASGLMSPAEEEARNSEVATSFPMASFEDRMELQEWLKQERSTRRLPSWLTSLLTHWRMPCR